MLTTDFPGSRDLVRMLDAALELPTIPDITCAIRKGLCQLMREGNVQLPACVFEGRAEHYARRELYRSERHGYAVTAMTWGPGQGTPIHDHHGEWCVEGVWCGALEITQYELRECNDGRYRFDFVGAIEAGTGSAGSLIPPHEYHAVHNLSNDQIAVSLHIYSAPMTSCAVFRPEDAPWYCRDVRQLSLDSVD